MQNQTMSASLLRMLQMKWNEDSATEQQHTTTVVDSGKVRIVGVGEHMFIPIRDQQDTPCVRNSTMIPGLRPPKPSTIQVHKQPKGALQTILIIPDVHSYARSESAFQLCMAAAEELAATTNLTQIIQLGDLLECGELSRHGASSVYERIPTYMEEVEWAVCDFWGRLKQIAPKAKLVQLYGNHEDRLHNHLLKNMNLKPGMMAQSIYESLTPTEIYQRMGIHVVPYGGEKPGDGMYKITDKLYCTHGWSFATHAAKAHLDKMFGDASLIFGHTHRIQSYIRGDHMHGGAIGAWSFGSLAKNNMYYQKGQPNDHANGFGIVQTDGNYFNVIPVHILNDRGDDIVVLPTNGKELRIRNGKGN